MAPTVAPAPADARYFLDSRGEGRALRVRRHEADGVAVLSFWRGDECVATFRLDLADVPELVGALIDPTR